MPHRHPMAQGLLVFAYLILINFGVDVLAGAFSKSTAIRGLKQSATGA